ncbi:MAG: LolA family protein [Peptococcaceae bacterium]
MKRVVLWLGMFLLVICLVTSCGGKKTSEQASSPGETISQDNEDSTPDTSAPGDSSPRQEDSLARLFSKAKSAELAFDFTAVTPDATVEGKQWIKGKKFRNEITIEGETLIMIVDFDKEESYQYIPAENMAIKMDISEAADLYQDPEEYLENEDFQNAQIIETTTYEGLKCQVVFHEDPDGTATKLWVSEEYGIPLRIEEVDHEGGQTQVEYKNIKTGPLSDNLFQLPAGVEVTDMGQLMNNIPK